MGKSVNYNVTPYCTVRYKCKHTSFDKRYYRKVGSHPEETEFRKAALAIAGSHTGYHALGDYTVTIGHDPSKPTNATGI